MNEPVRQKTKEQITTEIKKAQMEVRREEDREFSEARPGFLRVLRFFPLLHRLIVSANTIKAKINAISNLSNLAELSLCTKWHTAGCT